MLIKVPRMHFKIEPVEVPARNNNNIEVFNKRDFCSPSQLLNRSWALLTISVLLSLSSRAHKVRLTTVNSNTMIPSISGRLELETKCTH